jgi:outer membrane protein insertion porin family
LKDVIKTSAHNLLSFLGNNDVYDPDRVESDRDLLRRFYLKHGYADVRVVSAVAEYDPKEKGFVVTYNIDEGPQYRVSTVNIQSQVQAVSADALRSRLRIGNGDVYNAEAVEKSVENLSIEVAKRGYPFAVVHPRGDRDFNAHTIKIVFDIEEGPRAYIERINIVGNTRTRDYVIRREFDIAEGDAYNRALIDRAERRLKNLNYFKSVKITNEPGSAPDRIIINVAVEEMSTGEFSVSGGYSTSDGWLAEVSVGERNLLGRGQYARAAVSYGQYSRGAQLSFVEPFFLGYRLAAGIDLFARQQFANSYVSYDTQNVGTTLKLGFSLSEELSLQARYSIYQQKITLPSQYNDCTALTSPASSTYDPTVAGAIFGPGNNCYSNGEASLPVRMELSQGAVLVSAPGYTLAYNALDNNKNPTSGWYAEFKQDFAGAGGDVNFIRSSVDYRQYYEILSDVVGVLHLQAGHVTGWGGQDLRMLDHFQMGPNLVRGFAPAGIGPRDLTPGTTNDALGGTMYWGASVEVQTPIFFLPKEVGIRGAVFADAGSLWDYRGPTYWAVTNESMIVGDSSAVRSSVGVGLIWDSPFGPLRFDLAYPITKEPYDRTQIFRFGGGTKF